MAGLFGRARSAIQGRSLGDNLGIIATSAEVEALAKSVPDNGDVYFVPAFSGLFAPRWRADARGFRFEGLPASTLPTQWLDAGTTVRGPAILQLGPEPLIGPQQVLLVNQVYPERMLRVVTDGVRPFTVEPLP